MPSVPRTRPTISKLADHQIYRLTDGRPAEYWDEANRSQPPKADHPAHPNAAPI